MLHRARLLLLATLCVAVFPVGARAQVPVLYTGSINGMVLYAPIPFPSVLNTMSPYVTSYPSGCIGVTAAWGAGGVMTLPPIGPPFSLPFRGTAGCDVRGGGMPGSGTATVTTAGMAPRAFTIPAADFSAMGLYSVATPALPVIQSVTSFSFSNGAGSFAAGLGWPDTTFSSPLRTGTYFGGTVTVPVQVIFDAGPSAFGGTMRLLAGSSNFYALQTTLGGGYQSSYSVNTKNLYAVGGSFGDVATGGMVTINFRTGPPPTGMITYSYMNGLTLTGFQWGTGTITGNASFPLDGSRSFFTTMGMDYRNPLGAGSIKMVTPWFAHFQGGLGFATEQELTLTFLPEPAKGTLLGAGVLLLGGLALLRRR